MYIQPILNPALTQERGYQLRYHPEQARLWVSDKRFNVVPAGRRSGKTEIVGKRKLILRAMAPPQLGGSPYPEANYFVAAPTFTQVKRIYWNDLKRLIPRSMIDAKSESELWIRLINQNTIWCVGLDKPERMEGFPWDGGVIDEIGNVKPDAWEANIRPALADRGGWCDFIGVPEGRNHYYDLDLAARTDKTGEWGHFHWISADILPAKEIEAAKATMDELTYLQEFEASFVNFSGRCYHAWDEKRNARQVKHLYNPVKPLILMFDFNVEPGVCAIGQELQVNRNHDYLTTILFDEVWIRRHSNTLRVCKAIKERYEKRHLGPVVCYGDATGGSGGSAKILGSDWELIGKSLRKIWGDRIKFRVRRRNPRERDRVNAVNSLLFSANEQVKLLVDPGCCPQIVRDFEGVILLEGGSGEIDKKSTPLLTHLTDAIGYYSEREYPVKRSFIRDLKV
ncbi:MAG: hypothetical protein ACYTBJ_00555 [Planctomycetota bacterium]|jgi:hypothetical protein